MQEDTATADKEVAAAGEELKALKMVQEGLEKELEEITGIPRDKGAFREAVVSAVGPARRPSLPLPRADN